MTITTVDGIVALTITMTKRVAVLGLKARSMQFGITLRKTSSKFLN